VVASKGSDAEIQLATLPRHVAEKVRNFVMKEVDDQQRDGNAKESIDFKPGELTSNDRRCIHAYCEAMSENIETFSTGPKNNRKLTIVRRIKSVFNGEQRSPATRKRTRKKDGVISGMVLTENVLARLLILLRHKEQLDPLPNLVAYHYHKKDLEVQCDGRIYEGGYIKLHNKSKSQFMSQLLASEGSCEDDEVAATVRAVIIMRGLPGCGKSSVAKFLSEKLNARRCSADQYFERIVPTLSRKDKDMSNFDSKRLAEAHDYCRGEFLSSLGRGEHLIIDNTNTTKKEYKFYLRHIEKHNEKMADADQNARTEYRAIILEILPSRHLGTYYDRNVHRVPKEAYRKMCSRWQPDPSALTLQAYCRAELDNDVKRSNAVQDRVSLQKWMTEKHCFHFRKNAKRTHIAMAIGTRPFMFVTVKDQNLSEFQHIYAETVGKGIEGGFLCEVASTPKFPLFFDVDLGSEIECHIARFGPLQGRLPSPIDISRCLQKSMVGRLGYDVRRTCIILCSECPQNDLSLPRTTPGTDTKARNFHIHCPEIIVTVEEALSIRKAFIQELEQSFQHQSINSEDLCESHAIVDWSRVVDKGVFINHLSLRMVFSRKATKGMDVGRAYSLLAVVGVDGNRDTNREKSLREDPIKLLRAATIRIQA